MSWEGCEKEKQQLRFDVLEKRGACGGMQKSRVMQSKQQARRIICTHVSCTAISKAKAVGKEVA